MESDEQIKVVVANAACASIGMACDLIGQTGCGAGEKCAWVRVAVAPNPIGGPGCVPDGNVDQGGSCTYAASGEATGYDNCKKGLTCNAR